MSNTMRLAALGAALLAAACDPATSPDPLGEPGRFRLSISAAVLSGQLTVEVSGPGIAQPLWYNFPVVDGVGAGTLEVPAGPDRLFDVRAYNADGRVTHAGSVTLQVRPGPNDPTVIRLDPIPGELPVEVTLGSVSVTVSPGQLSLDVGAQDTLAASIIDTDNLPLPGPAAWATLDPAIATVDADGVVTAVAAGETAVVAVYGGVAGMATVVVNAGGGT